MQRKRRETASAEKPRWNASQLVAFNLARARHKAGMTQQEAAEAISQYTEVEWTQPTVGSAESSVTGARIRQFSPSELLAFSFAFDVPVGWFFMPPLDGEADALEMPKHSGGIGWDWVFRRTAPTERNLESFLSHERDWPVRSEQLSTNPPYHERPGSPFRGGRVVNEDEMSMYLLLAYIRRGLGGSLDLRRQTAWGEADWFSGASAVLSRVSELFAAIGYMGPSPKHVVRAKDAEDARRIQEAIDRQRAVVGGPICAECFQPIELVENLDGGSDWVHMSVPEHAVVPEP